MLWIYTFIFWKRWVHKIYSFRVLRSSQSVFFLWCLHFPRSTFGLPTRPTNNQCCSAFPFSRATETLFCEDHADSEILRINCHVTRSFIQEAIWKGLDTPTGLHEIVQYSYVAPPKRCFLKLAKHLQVFISFSGDINNVYFDFGSSHRRCSLKKMCP